MPTDFNDPNSFIQLVVEGKCNDNAGVQFYIKVIGYHAHLRSSGAVIAPPNDGVTGRTINCSETISLDVFDSKHASFIQIGKGGKSLYLNTCTKTACPNPPGDCVCSPFDPVDCQIEYTDNRINTNQAGHPPRHNPGIVVKNYNTATCKG